MHFQVKKKLNLMNNYKKKNFALKNNQERQFVKSYIKKTYYSLIYNKKY